ncbi:hypothetical protein HYH03_000373 [Edaphochlamys debaryana]|uniref:MYND-type domain-containing protein n=1 Tax=Edaphochlamys debaryana TaxID=47281 RepID=A0A835YNU6_9CHLO|nr:hypothetical protein HYH03_000373 [Edaphochlamys debaryana]|eukprot:KAG2501875.1 hypothetical protein HYH03_000373 [Edaphochlamys debaryana]
MHPADEARAMEERRRIDEFHARFLAKQERQGAAAEAASTPGDEEVDPDLACGGCGIGLEREGMLVCGQCRTTAYCDRQCQTKGWKEGGHKQACKWLARARELPPPSTDRSYVVQIKLVGAEGLRMWAEGLRRGDDADVAEAHEAMAQALRPRERVLFALEGRHHQMLKFQMVPPTKRLGAADLALFALQAIVQPHSGVPTLNMTPDDPQRPYAIWLPGIMADRPMAEPVGDLLAGAGLAVSSVYVGGGFAQEMRLYGDSAGFMVEVDVDYFTEDESSGSEEYGNDEDTEPDSEEEAAGAARAQQAQHAEAQRRARRRRTRKPRTQGAGTAAAEGAEADVEGEGEGRRRQGPAAGAQGARPRVLVVSGLHMFGEAPESEDPLLGAVAGALRSQAGAELEVAYYKKKGGARAQEAVAQQLLGGGFEACVVLGLGSGDDFKPRTPTFPWGEGPWKQALTQWVAGGGVLVVHGERAAAAVAREWFGLAWTMEGDWYRRTDHVLCPTNPLLGPLARRLPVSYNVKAAMLGDVPGDQRIYSTAPGAVTHSHVPLMAGAPVGDRTVLAGARVGQGAVGFFGDVNWEAPTMATVAGLVKHLVASRRAAVAAAGSGASS